MKDRLLRPDQAAERLNVSKRTVYRLLAEGQITGLKVRTGLRVIDTSLDEYVSRQIALYRLENGTIDDSE